MAERPLLIFPSPQQANRSTLGGGGGDNFIKPSHSRQGERVTLQLTRLQDAFERRAAEVLASPDGLDPSQVIVIETVGSVSGFATAVRRIEGLEWLGEFEIDEIAPDEDFYRTDSDENPNDKSMRGRLYLVFTDQAAMQQLLAQWERYKNDRNVNWERGLTSLRDVFDNLHDIRRWDVQDRLEESGALEIWREELEHAPDEVIRTEIELWYRGSQEVRNQSQRDITLLVNRVGGTVIQSYELAAIAYHAMLVELPRRAIAGILKNPNTELVKCDGIMYFRPTGQIAAGERLDGQERSDAPDRGSFPYPTGDPCIAILDGLPVENHLLLRDRLYIEDPDDLSPNYQVRDRLHGTGMCSLVVWGDLTDTEPPLARPVYVRPITVPVESLYPPYPERMPSDQLSIDVIHRAVRRMFEGEGGSPPSAPTVKIINLSIGDLSRPFLQMVSPFARLIDWLSYKYGVLFVISAGNQLDDIPIAKSKTELDALSPAEREKLIIDSLYRESRHRRMLSPAESINGLTVNSSNHDSSGDAESGRLFECYRTPLPSPISSFGSGYRRSIKPEVVYPGGRVLYDFSLDGNRAVCRPHRRRPGHQVAAPGTAPGDGAKTSYSRGTSNAAALVTRSLGFAYETLTELLDEQASDVPVDPYVAPLLKSLVVHSSNWDVAGDRLLDILSTNYDSRSIKHAVSRWLGYGEPDVNRMLECTKQRATVLGFGSLSEEQGHEFAMPLPTGLGSRKTVRRLTVTLAWFSPIVSTNQKYRAAQLWFDMPGNRLARDRQDADWQAVRRGTVQHEVFEGDEAIAITTGDSIGVKVSCKSDAARVQTPIHYGLAVSLEVAEGIDISIYDEVRAAIAIRPEIDIRTRNPIE